MKWNIITDSSCDLFDLNNRSGNIEFSSIPFVISVGKKDCIDNKVLDVSEMITAMENCESVTHTSCPPPYAWCEQFEKPGYSVAVTISSKLSGCYNSANTAKGMILEACPDKKIAVIDSRSAGPEIVLIVEKLCEIIKTGADFDTVISSINEYIEKTHIIFALSSFNNLVKNGHMNRLTGIIAGKLGFWGIGIGSEEGTIQFKQKVRGNLKALDAIICDIKECGTELKTVVISHCQNAEMAEKLKKAMLDICHNVKIKIVQTRGLCSYYAERGGLMVGYYSNHLPQ
ncbi:MAG: DegV family protein [[Eubacterium] siraeum]|nr:DegV family protein [[Eubacterium] siraeum]